MTYQLRHDLKGMVIGPIDKNKGELFVMCPALYEMAWTKAYNEHTGYDSDNRRSGRSAISPQNSKNTLYAITARIL